VNKIVLIAAAIAGILIFEPAAARADQGYVTNASQSFMPYVNNKPVWSGDVPNVVSSNYGEQFAYAGQDNSGDAIICGGPSTVLSFTVVGLWRSSLDQQTTASLKIEGLTSDGQVLFSAAKSVMGTSTYQISGSPYCADPYPVTSLRLTTTVSVIGTSTKWVTVSNSPYKLSRLPQSPVIVFRDAQKPSAIINDKTITTSGFYLDRNSYPALTGYRLGLAQSDTEAGLTSINPSQVIDLGVFQSPKQELGIEKIAPLITNPDGYFTIEAKGINGVGESENWSLATLPLHSRDLISKYQSIQSEAAATAAAAAQAKAKADLLAAQIAGLSSKFKNCSALNLLYPGGISLSAKAKNIGKVARQIPYVSAKAYKLNSPLDSDKDGIACER
jgi:hypothetical protein